MQSLPEGKGHIPLGSQSCMREVLLATAGPWDCRSEEESKRFPELYTSLTMSWYILSTEFEDTISTKFSTSFLLTLAHLHLFLMILKPIHLHPGTDNLPSSRHLIQSPSESKETPPWSFDEKEPHIWVSSACWQHCRPKYLSLFPRSLTYVRNTSTDGT